MPQRYKLRLGDGTIRLVDADELRAWLGDGNAMAQTPGSYRWSPLRDFIAEDPALLLPPQPSEGETSPDPDPAVPPPSDRVARPSRGEPTPVQALADDSDRFPTLRLKPFGDRDEEPAPQGSGCGAVEDHGDEAVPHPRWRDRLGQRLLPAVAALGSLLSRSLARLMTRQDRPSEPLTPPAPASELPTLPLVAVPEPRKAERPYEGGGEGVSPFQTRWLWTKRSAWITGLVAGGILGVLSWEAWLPSVARLGQMMFSGTDRHVPSPGPTAEQQRALRAATQELPQLAPGTIRILLSSSPSGVLDPSEVFQLAGDAADRGRSALTPREAKELKALQRDLVRTLRPVERQSVREYDRTRSTRFVFASEKRYVLELCARGARALPPPKRERLQVLLGKAISAGLVRPWDAATR